MSKHLVGVSTTQDYQSNYSHSSWVAMDSLMADNSALVTLWRWSTVSSGLQARTNIDRNTYTARETVAAPTTKSWRQSIVNAAPTMS